ncbi:Starch-binding associating with outer membrane [Porphyromonadaceae bacterium NLAE-zl-C104]|nr:Starch-binding associating with outer membrane [Porphyromonadaceae bacterium NLAE-zl-C104]
MKINILKILVISLMLLLVFPFTSCDESTIDLNPTGDTEATFYNNERQMTMAVMGIYQKVGFFYRFRNNQNTFQQSVWLIPSDDLTTQASHAMEYFIALTGQTGQLNDFYMYCYQLIARSNTLLEKIEENGDFAYQSEPELKAHHRGEALFLRAWAYYLLWNTYGTAPLVTERITDLADAYPPNSKDTELLDQAIIDLQEASNLLPASWNAANRGRVTKNSAHALCGKILVFRGTVKKANADFVAAINEFNAISGVSLMPNYGDNFDYTKEDNAESLFEYHANEQSSNNNNAGLDNDGFAVVGDVSAWYGMFTQKPTWIGTAVYSATQSLIDAYEPGDPRWDYTLTPDAKGTDLINVVKYTRDGMPTFNKQNNEQSKNNPRILRYADVLLLKAEAIVRSGGNLSEAIAILNQIRERARKSDVSGTESPVPADLDLNETDAAKVLEWVFQERRIELACEEGHRWYDLRRRHIAGEIDLKNWDFSSKRVDLKFEDHHVYFPLPEQEVIESPNLNQNPGY